MSIKLYMGLGSGNAYKAELMLHLLSVAYEPISVRIHKDEHQSPEFLELTPFGQIPVLVDDDMVLIDSQAILCYLARKYGGSEVDKWLVCTRNSIPTNNRENRAIILLDDWDPDTYLCHLGRLLQGAISAPG